MRGTRAMTVLALCAVLAGNWVWAAPADPVKDQLDVAKAARSDQRTRARAALIKAFDAPVKTAAAAGDLDTLKALTAQKDAFMTAGVLPNLAALKDAVAQYTQSMRKADGELVAAYESAIEGYSSQSKNDEVMALRKERHALLEGTADLPAPDSPEAVGILLDRAKADYQQAVGDAKKAFVQAIDARLKMVTDAGDLNSVTKLRAAKTAAEADAPFAEGFNDAASLGGKARYGGAIQLANQKLAVAYREAIRNYTRLRAIDKAQAVQAELEATGLGSPAAAGSGAGAGSTGSAGGPTPPEGMIKLTRALPTYLSATGGFAAEKEGVRPAKNVIVSTKLADFLSKDFIFDVAVNVPKDEEWAIVGLGDTTEKGSLRIVIRNDSGWGRRAFLTHGDTWGQHIGDVHSGELYVIRLERHGGPITASVGSIADGKFTADMSQTVSDLKSFVPDLSEKRAHLFFAGSVVFTQVRLAVGAAAASGGGSETRPLTTPIKFPVTVGGAGAGATGPGTVAGADPTAVGASGAPIAASPARGADDADAAKGVYRLTSDKLPAPFSATGTFSVTAAGLKPYDDKCLIITKDEDFLSKDFILEASVDVPQKLDKDSIVLGLGDGTDKGSLRMLVRVDGGWGIRVFLALGDRWGKHFGEIREAGPRVLRLERHGTAVTVSLGTEKDGKFEPEMSQTVADAKAAVADMSERRAHLFFTGKVTWSKLRLVTGDAATGPAASAASPPVNAAKPGKKR